MADAFEEFFLEKFFKQIENHLLKKRQGFKNIDDIVATFTRLFTSITWQSLIAAGFHPAGLKIYANSKAFFLMNDEWNVSAWGTWTTRSARSSYIFARLVPLILATCTMCIVTAFLRSV